MKTVGFPMIHNFAGDKRDFVPELFRFMDKYADVDFFLEEGYGERLGYHADDYLKASKKVHFVKMEEAYKQDITMILKDPELPNLELLKDGSIFFTMLHYSTRPAVIEVIKRKQLKTYSMDSIVDDQGIRLFVDYFGTAYEACKAGIHALKESYSAFYSPDRPPIKALVMGAGGVGQGVVKSLEILSDQEFLGQDALSGIIPSFATRTITRNKDLMRTLLAETDLLIDATQRKNQSIQILDNEDVGFLPEHAVIVDICADRYDFDQNPPLRRVVEGTVNGNPSNYIIQPDDPLYDELPSCVNSNNRRIVVSCDAWPGMDPQRSVQYYYGLLKNYVGLILTKDYEDISEDSDNLFERALFRSTLSYFETHKGGRS